MVINREMSLNEELNLQIKGYIVIQENMITNDT